MALCQLRCAGGLRIGIVKNRVVHDDFAVQPHSLHSSRQVRSDRCLIRPESGIRSSAPKILSFPAGGEPHCGSGMNAEGLEIDNRIYPRYLRRAAQVRAAKYSPWSPGFPSLVDSTALGTSVKLAQEICSRHVGYLSGRKLLANSLQRRDGVRSRAAVVAVQHLRPIPPAAPLPGSFSYPGRERQHAIVLEQHHRFAGNLQSQVGGEARCRFPIQASWRTAPSPADRTFPSRMRAVKSRRKELSRSASVSSPCFTASTNGL